VAVIANGAILWAYLDQTGTPLVTEPLLDTVRVDHFEDALTEAG